METNCKQRKISGGIGKTKEEKMDEGFDKTKSLFFYIVAASDDLGSQKLSFTVASSTQYNPLT
jgi:hypothetical protein